MMIPLFIASSRNRAIMQKIENDAYRAKWDTKPTEVDVQEFEAWLKKWYAIDLEITTSMGLENEAEALEKWKKGKK